MKIRHLTRDDLRGRRWRGLVRESTERQAEQWSPARQRSDIVRAASDLGMVPAEPLWYERVGSGEAEAVPELAQALADGKAGQYDVLVVLATSRFARNRAEAVRMKAEFRRAGIVIYFVADQIISGTYAGGLSEGIREVLDEHENETRRMWIAGGLRERQLAGRWVGTIPYGYRRVMADFEDGSRGWNGELEPDPEEAAVVRRIFEAVATGATTRSVALQLNLAGHRTRRGVPWQRATVARVVMNPIYGGETERYRLANPAHYYAEDDPADGRQEIPAPPAILDPSYAESVRTALSARRLSLRPKERYVTYPLSKVLRCAACGGKMTGVSSAGVRYYRCASRARSGTCDAPHARADRLEEQFAEWIDGFTLPEDWRQAIARIPLATAKAEERGRQEQLAERLGRLKNLYAWGDLAETEYREQSAELRAQMALVTLPNVASIAAVAEALANLGESWTIDPDPLIPSLLLREAVVEARRVRDWVVWAELRPLLELCTPGALSSDNVAGVHVRFSA